MLKLKENKGITLIALIITIIVMLILVGVTINVALNGGLFDKAEDAAIGTEKQAIYEQIVSNMELTNDGKISVKGTFDKVIAQFGGDKVTNITPATVDTSTTEVIFSIVGKTGTYKYKISEKNIEKNPLESAVPPTPPQEPPSELAGNVYEGVAGTVYIAKNYKYLWFPQMSSALLQYEYENGEVIIYIPGQSSTLNGTVSDDKGTISVNYNGTTLEFSLATDKEYTPEYLTSEHKQVYIGIYYNEANQKFATIYYDLNVDDAIKGWFQYENLMNGGYQNAAALVTTYDDSKTIQKNNDVSDNYGGEYIKYTLLEAGQF